MMRIPRVSFDGRFLFLALVASLATAAVPFFEESVRAFRELADDHYTLLATRRPALR